VEGNADAIPLLAQVLGIKGVKEEEEDELLNPLDMDDDDDDDDLMVCLSCC
jgi:symplekin